MLNAAPSSLTNQIPALTAAISQFPSQAVGSVGTGFSAELKASVQGALDQTATAMQEAKRAVDSSAQTYRSTVSFSPIGSGRAQLQQDFNAFFTQVSGGKVVNVDSGTVTRNPDGSATWRGGNVSYTFTQSTPLDDVAANTGLGAEWAQKYGVSWGAAASSQPTSSGSTLGSNTTVKAPFSDFDSFKTWEQGLKGNFAPDYEAPDYVHMLGLSLGGGDAEAFKRFVFFKNNPEMAIDFENVHSGKLSAFPCDGSTLIKSDLSAMPTEVAAYYKANPNALLLAESFGTDPVLLKQRMERPDITLPAGLTQADWLRQNKWTANGPVSNNNVSTLAKADYIGLDGKGAGTYKLASWDSATGGLLDLDGKVYDALTGVKMT